MLKRRAITFPNGLVGESSGTMQPQLGVRAGSTSAMNTTQVRRPSSTTVRQKVRYIVCSSLGSYMGDTCSRCLELLEVSIVSRGSLFGAGSCTRESVLRGCSFVLFVMGHYLLYLQPDNQDRYGVELGGEGPKVSHDHALPNDRSYREDTRFP